MTSQIGLRSQQVALWLIAGLLALIAAALFLDRSDGTAGLAAYAQQVSAAPVGARGIYMLPAQLSPNSYGLFMMDVDAGTVWCYEYVASTRKLRLAAARSWIFDRYLEEYNVTDIPPAEVAALVQKQRSQRSRLQEVLDKTPTGGQGESR